MRSEIKDKLLKYCNEYGYSNGYVCLSDNDDDENLDYFCNVTLRKLFQNTSEDEYANRAGILDEFLLYDEDLLRRHPKIFNIDKSKKVTVKLTPEQQESPKYQGILESYKKDLANEYNKKRQSEYNYDVKNGIDTYGLDVNKDGVVIARAYETKARKLTEEEKEELDPRIDSLKTRLFAAKALMGLGLGTAAISGYHAINDSDSSSYGSAIKSGIGLAAALGAGIANHHYGKKLEDTRKTTVYEIDPNKYYTFTKNPNISMYDLLKQNTMYDEMISPLNITGGPYDSREEARAERPKSNSIHRGSVVLRYPGFVQK